MGYRKLRTRGQYTGLNEFIDDMFKIRKISEFVEIGSYAGESTMMFVDKFVDARIYCIDPWNDMDFEAYEIDKVGVGSYTKPSLVESVFDENIKNYNNITKIKLTSEEASSQFDDNCLDMIYMDGIHTAKYITIDLEKWIPKIKSGGIIAGHDYSGYFQSYRTYIKEYFGREPNKIYSDKSWYYIKE